MICLARSPTNGVLEEETAYKRAIHVGAAIAGTRLVVNACGNLFSCKYVRAIARPAWESYW